MSRVWGRAAISDNNLHVQIAALRKVLGDDCIVTKQGRGYRFTAKVQRTPPQAPDPANRSGNLPADESLSRLIGRADQLRVASKLLARSRLLTLTGPGGVGKTKLAAHAANKSRSRFPDGIWLVELASLRDPDSVITATAAVLGIGIADKGNPLETLGCHLSQRKLLIVLDNCEHVLGATASLCEAILKVAPDVKVLATSREDLGCAGEQILEIPPLTLPSSDATQPFAIRGTAAVDLFVERAMSADAGFRMADKDACTVSRICHRVDGLPLAIEMVAGWAAVFQVETLEAKLGSFIRGWLRARSTAPARHSTLRATLEWSHDLLSATEQAVLRRLAVFAGSFDLQACEAVASNGDVSGERVFEFLASLVRKSMVATVPESQGRYRLLETTRAFMLEKLASSVDHEETRRKHARCVLRRVECAMAEWETTSDTIWRDRYRPIVDDLRAALDWTIDQRPDLAVALAGASWPLWRELSLVAEGWRRLSQAKLLLHASTPPEHEARLRRGVAEFWVNTTTTKSLRPELMRVAELYRAVNDLPSLGDTLRKLAFMACNEDRLQDAEETITEALALLDAARHPRTLAKAYNVQMCVEFRLGRTVAGHRAGAEAVALCERVGADWIALMVEANLVELTLDSGDLGAAVSKGRELRERMGERAPSDLRGFALTVLTAALTMRGDLDEALTTAREAAPLLYNHGQLLWLFDHLALRSGLTGCFADAALLAGYADAVHEKSEYPRWPMESRAAERLCGMLRDALSEHEIIRFGEMGAQMSEDQAMTLALSI